MSTKDKQRIKVIEELVVTERDFCGQVEFCVHRVMPALSKVSHMTGSHDVMEGGIKVSHIQLFIIFLLRIFFLDPFKTNLNLRSVTFKKKLQSTTFVNKVNEPFISPFSHTLAFSQLLSS